MSGLYKKEAWHRKPHPLIGGCEIHLIMKMWNNSPRKNARTIIPSCIIIWNHLTFPITRTSITLRDFLWNHLQSYDKKLVLPKIFFLPLKPKLHKKSFQQKQNMAKKVVFSQKKVEFHTVITISISLNINIIQNYSFCIIQIE